MTAPTVERTSITEPGVYVLDEQTYHGDPVPGGSLSCSGAKRLLSPGCPALFDYERRNGQKPRRVFDFGHAAHTMVLGIGATLVIVQKTARDGSRSDAADYKSVSAQEHRDLIRGTGAAPVLREEYDRVVAMAEAIRAHPIASRLLDPEHGAPERSLFRRDAGGTMLRSRLDWLPDPTSSGRMVLPDYKTAVSAEPRQIEKAIAKCGYHQQAAWYGDMVLALELAEDVTFRFVFQEKTAPYLVTVVEPDDEAIALGRTLNRTAIDLYADCVKRNRWPGYTDDVELVSLPPWATYEHDMDVI